MEKELQDKIDDLNNQIIDLAMKFASSEVNNHRLEKKLEVLEKRLKISEYKSEYSENELNKIKISGKLLWDTLNKESMARKAMYEAFYNEDSEEELELSQEYDQILEDSKKYFN